MHLRSIRIKGFKSFPDPVEVRLEPGVAVVVGPNGSGKSNVADALLWASGSLSPQELRAEKPDDVLFAGAADRFVLNASSPGTLVVRVRASTHWALRGEGCVEATDDGWTQVRVDVPGVVEVVQALRGTPCAG